MFGYRNHFSHLLYQFNIDVSPKFCILTWVLTPLILLVNSFFFLIVWVLLLNQ